jgi:translation initiation factor 2 beta subunit (eIF-2beta)/eIF-5
MNFSELLDNVYTILGDSCTDLLVLPEPEFDKGTTRVIWKNIKAFLKITNTPPDHLFDFIEKQTNKKLSWFSESVSDGLIIHDKRFSKSEGISLMKKYTDNYVLCNICKKSNTQLFKDSEIRKYKIKCEDCCSEYTI